MGHVVNPHLFRLNYVLFWSTSLITKKKHSMYFEVNSVYILKYLQNYFKKYDFITTFKLYNSCIKLIYLNNILKIFLLFNQSAGFKKILKKKINKKLTKNFKNHIKKTIIKNLSFKQYTNNFVPKKKLFNKKLQKIKFNLVNNVKIFSNEKKSLKNNMFLLKKKKFQLPFFYKTNLNKKLSNINQLKHKTFNYKKKSRKLKISKFNLETKNLFINESSFKQKIRKKFQILANNVYAVPYPKKRRFFYMYKSIINLFSFKNKFLKLNKNSFLKLVKDKNLKRNKIPISINWNVHYYRKRRGQGFLKKQNINLHKFLNFYKKNYKTNWKKYKILKKISKNINKNISNFFIRFEDVAKKKTYLNKVYVPIFFEMKKLAKKKKRFLNMVKSRNIYNVKKFLQNKFLWHSKKYFNIKKQFLFNFNASFSELAFELKFNTKRRKKNPAIFDLGAYVKRLHMRRKSLHFYRALEKIRLSYSMVLPKKQYFRDVFVFAAAVHNYPQKNKIKFNYSNLRKKLQLKKFNNNYKILIKKLNKKYKKNTLKIKKYKKWRSKKKTKKLKKNIQFKFKKISLKKKYKKFEKVHDFFNSKIKNNKISEKIEFISNKNKDSFFKSNLKYDTLSEFIVLYNKNKKKLKKKIIKLIYVSKILKKKWKYNKSFIKNLKRKTKKKLKKKLNLKIYSNKKNLKIKNLKIKIIRKIKKKNVKKRSKYLLKKKNVLLLNLKV